MTNILEQRLNRGLGLQETASEMGISRTTLRRAETGETPRAGVAKKIADFYGVLVTDIWPVPDRSAA